ncbi:MAG TPA: TonB-dependent receptor [Woeseiaceae bacterium]|nr:TonB-dependent receptor [Woeseiaceae bacterium]
MAAVLAVLVTGGSGFVLAQERAPTRELEEIVVTAQKREQTLLEIPQSITVVDGQLLRRQQADNFEDYLSLVPGLSLQSATPGNTRITLRGVNTGGVASTVGVYVDEVPFGSSSGLANAAILAGDFDTFDVARLEVLRGPQGTLYGASSLGGVIRFVTNAPDTREFRFRAEAGLENVAEGDLGWAARSFVNIPLSERFAVRASGFYRAESGFIDSIGNNPIPSLTDPANNIVDGSLVLEDLNETDVFGGRVSALFDTGGVFSAQLTALFQDIEADGSANFEGDFDTYEPLYGGLVKTQYHRDLTDTEYRIYSGLLNWELGAGTLLSSTSYSTFAQHIQDDAALFPVPPALAQVATLFYGDPATRPLSVIQKQITGTDKFTQEFRFTSPDGEVFEWLAGAFYTREKSRIDPQDFFAVEAGTDDIAEDIPVLLSGQVHSEYEEYAAFGNATWYLTERFEINFGGRASRNEQSASQVLDLSGLGAGVVAFDEATSSEDVFTWSVGPRFSLNDDTSVYARIATGYRPGGPNVLPPGAPPGTPATYDSDTLTSYEAGLKGDWANLSLDVAVFFLDWEDIQLFAQINDVGVNANGGTAESRGIELNAAVRPLDGLTLSLNGAWIDTELTQDTDPIVGGVSGDSLPWTPELSATFAADYEWQVAGDVTAWVGGDVSYTGTRTADFGQRDANGAIRELPSYTTLDLRAGFDTGSWFFELYARNLTDERGITSLFGPDVVANGAAGIAIIRPRTVGLTVGVEF